MMLDIKERLTLLARGDNLDLADIVCADAVARIEALESMLRIMATNQMHPAQYQSLAREVLAQSSPIPVKPGVNAV